VARIAFPSYDVQTLNGRAGGVGAFITQFARMLKERGDEVSIIATRGETHGFHVDTPWRERYRSWGIDLVEINNKAPSAKRWPELWPMRLSEQVAPLLRGFDVVYFAYWANVAFHTVRARRLSRRPAPTCVTVLHGPNNWIRLADRRYPQIPDDLNLEFLERYSARHSDFVIAPSQHILDWARSDGWEFEREPEVLGLPFRPDALDERDRTATGGRAQELRRLVYFGRLEPRKGYDLFVAALRQLKAESPEVLRRLDQIVLLGHEDVPGAASWVRRELEPSGTRITHMGKLDSLRARGYLSEHVEDTLVVIPSRFENFPMAVIEASLIPGLNVICTRGGGAPEVLGPAGEDQLFDPLPRSLATKIRERLDRPLPPQALARYEYQAANARWLAFHERACAHARRARTVRAPTVDAADRSVDVCVTYFNKAQHFPQLLESLEQQTYQGFRVIAVDDGSTDPKARRVFEAMAQRYAARGWTFFRQGNAQVEAARNEAARHSQAEFLLMVDADDVFARNAVERMLEAALLSGDDCLVGGSILFAGDGFPYDVETGQVTAPIFGHYMPIGASVVAGILDPAVFGGPAILVRRKVFEEIGGYRELRGVAHEDWELHARLALAGYRTDVVPEYLHFYRQLDDGLSRTSNEFLAKERMLEAYDRHLAPAHLYGAAHALFALQRESRELERRVFDLERQLRSGPDRFHGFGLKHTLGLAEPSPESEPEYVHEPEHTTAPGAGLERFQPDGQGAPVLRALRRAYRRRVPLEVRLRLHERLMSLIGRDPYT